MSVFARPANVPLAFMRHGTAQSSELSSISHGVHSSSVVTGDAFVMGSELLLAAIVLLLTGEPSGEPEMQRSTSSEHSRSSYSSGYA